jgi:hypothetical protein
LDVIGTKVFRVFLLASGSKLVCNVKIVYRNLKPENFQDYAQKPQRKCTFKNSASGVSMRKGKEEREIGRNKGKGITANSEEWIKEKGGKEK